MPKRDQRHGQFGANRDVLIFFSSANVDFQLYTPTVVGHRAGKQREAPKSQRLVLRPSVEEQLQGVDRQMKFFDHDACQAWEVAEAAESLEEEASFAIAGFAQRSSVWNNQMPLFDGTTRSCAGFASPIR